MATQLKITYPFDNQLKIDSPRGRNLKVIRILYVYFYYVNRK